MIHNVYTDKQIEQLQIRIIKTENNTFLFIFIALLKKYIFSLTI